MSHDVFISYSNKDKTIADGVCSKLEDNKIRVWIAPRDVPGGSNFADSIIEAIDTCKIFVLIWSANTNASEHILNEIEEAFDQGVTIIPFRIQDVEPTRAMRYYFGRTHWLDAMTPPLEKHIKLLADTILTNLGRQAEIQPEIPVVKEKEVHEEKKKEKEEDKKLVSKPSAKPRAWWPYLAGLFGVAVVVGLALTLLKQPAQPTSNPLTNAPATMEMSSQPTNIPMETETAKPPSTPLPTEKAGYQTQDLGTPYYQSGFTQTDFDMNEWPVRDSKGQRYYRGEDDTYQFDIQTIQPSYASNPSTALFLEGKKKYTNSLVEVEAKFVEDGGEVEIFCRTILSGYSGYMASFNKNGRTTISSIGADWRAPKLFSGNSAIKETGIYYRLRFDCIGQQLTVYENGVKIGEAQDNNYYVGSIGLGTNGAPLRVAFDNFKLWLP